MAYDEVLAGRVRQALTARDVDDVREVRMFGGLAVMVDDRMLVCVGAGGGALLVRVSPADEARLVGQPGARRAEMGSGRSMGPGWLAVDAEALSTEEGLERWLGAALAFHAASTTR